MEKSLIEDLGSEITAIVTPVSVCMLLVVLMVHGLNPHGSEGGGPAIGALVYQERSTDTTEEKLGGAMLNALVFIVAIAAVTFVLVLLFYCRCMKFLWCYMGFSGFMILAWLGGYVFVKAIDVFNVPMDVVTFMILLYNFAVVGMVAIFSSRMPIFLTQSYLVLIGALVAFWFTHLPEWTTWLLLVAMAVYDLAAVLLPGGPLKVLVEMAIERDEDLPVLIYEARPQSLANSNRGMQPLPTQSPTSDEGGHSQPPRRRWAGRRGSRGVGGRANSESSLSGLAAGNMLPRDESAVPPSVTLSASTMDNGSALPGGSVNHVPTQMPGNGPVQRSSVAQGEREEGMLLGLRSHAANGALGMGRDAGSPARFESPTAEGSEPSSPLSPGDVDEGQPLVRHTSSSGSGLEALHEPVHPPVERVAGGRVMSQDEQRIDQSEHGPSNGSNDESFGLPDAIKLGLGDFIFYSVLVGRAAMYDLMTVYACYLAIMAGLGATLVLLAVYRKALPALPFSIALGVIFYFLTRLVMDPFVVGLSTRLVFF